MTDQYAALVVVDAHGNRSAPTTPVRVQSAVTDSPLAADVAEIRTNVESMVTRLGSLEPTVTSLGSTVSTLSSELNTTRNALTDLTGRVAALEEGGTGGPSITTRKIFQFVHNPTFTLAGVGFTHLYRITEQSSASYWGVWSEGDPGDPPTNNTINPGTWAYDWKYNGDNGNKTRPPEIYANAANPGFKTRYGNTDAETMPTKVWVRLMVETSVFESDAAPPPTTAIVKLTPTGRSPVSVTLPMVGPAVEVTFPAGTPSDGVAEVTFLMPEQRPQDWTRFMLHEFSILSENVDVFNGKTADNSVTIHTWAGTEYRGGSTKTVIE